MKWKTRVFVALALATVTREAFVAQEPTAPRAREKTTFCANEPAQNAATLSPQVLKLLLETKEAKKGLGYANDTARENPSQLFQALEIHLGSPDDLDLLVIGVPPMSDADNDWFWLVHSPRKDPVIVLFASGNCLEMLTTRTNGYHDIRTVWAGAAESDETIYQFDGRVYKLLKKTRKSNH